MTAVLPIQKAGVDPAWRDHLTSLGAAWAAILLIFHRDAGDIVPI